MIPISCHKHGFSTGDLITLIECAAQGLTGTVAASPDENAFVLESLSGAAPSTQSCRVRPGARLLVGDEVMLAQEKLDDQSIRMARGRTNADAPAAGKRLHTCEVFFHYVYVPYVIQSSIQSMGRIAMGGDRMLP